MFVRWDQQIVEREAGARLPGYRDATIRHFDAPEAVDTRFYEVEAKSILNQVPPASQMPFRWTINPYRGCTHSCSYCMSGATPVLMADGRHKPLESLEVGDAIYGTAIRGQYRRYVSTQVLAKWVSAKPAFKLVLADGTELITSGDHRFLSDRGWKHVTDAPGRRPHLTLQNHLVGTGAFTPQHEATPDYRRGYLTGMIRGEGTIGTSSYPLKNGSFGTSDRFRLALTDTEALSRTSCYLFTEEIATRLREFAPATERRRQMLAVAVGGRPQVDQIRELIAWPVAPSTEWFRGFLAGIFDAEGSRSHSALRISNQNPEILVWVERAATRFGFDTCLDVPSASGAQSVRIRGGLREHLRFFHLTDPAITRKRAIDGEMVKTFADLQIVAVEPLNRSMPLYDITTGTGDFIANGVVSHNCFARPTHEYLGLGAGRDFEREIVVKVNAPELLRAELRRPRWEHEHVALGTNTDPYQWVEGRYELMRGIWQAMRDARNPCSVLTKSPLLLRDLDLMRELDAVTDFSAALSIPTLDREAWRTSEPRSPNPRARLQALAELTSAGIRTGVLIAPLMPGINDSPEQVREIVREATAAGADYITGIALHLRRGVREVFMEWLAEHRPELVAQYERLYRRGAYMPADERRRLAQMLQGPSTSARQRTSRFLRRDPSPADLTSFRRGNRSRRDEQAFARPPEPVQQTLF
ncbi:MAG TPA: LAGLIDADG family homing endonuclease [Solirubrobacteraceae bacterium]|nr:LAGLIDADG family homing endonuclease [Solirubrobacteraceae bacterium]